MFFIFPGTTHWKIRLTALFVVLTYFLMNPILTPGRQLDFAAWKVFLAGVPGVHKEATNWVYPGPDFPLKRELPNLDTSDSSAFKVFEDQEAVTVLKEFIDH